MLENRQLQTFIQTAEEGSFSKAARKAFVSPTALIQQINLLEKRLKIKLFLRSHQGLTLTEAGRSFYKDAKYILQYMQDSVARAQQAAREDVPPVRLGTSLMTPSQFLLGLWPDIQKKDPELNIRLVPFDNTPENAKEILSRLGQHIDVVAGPIDEGFKETYGCAMLELFRAPVRVAVSRHHPLAAKDILQPQDLFGQKFLLLKRRGFKRIDKLRQTLERKYPQIQIMDFPFYDINVFNQCQSGDFLLMTIENWDNVHPLLKTLPVAWDYTIPFGLMYAPSPSPQVQRFLQAIRALKQEK